jgi:hypothetical protein
MADTFARICARLATIYGPARKEDDGLLEYYRELSKLVSQYNQQEQDKAAELIIRNHKSKSWPDIPAILRACADAREILHPPKGHIPRMHTRDNTWTEEAFTRADELCRGEMGRIANREGWLMGLHEFVRAHSRLPTQAEIADIKDTAKWVERVASGDIEVSGPAHRMAPQWASTALERRQRLAERLFGGVVA